MERGLLQPAIKESCSTNVFKKKVYDYYLSFYDCHDIFHQYYYYHCYYLLVLLISYYYDHYSVYKFKNHSLHVLSCLLPKVQTYCAL